MVELYSLGDTVEADWGLRGVHYMGVVTAINGDGSYRIQYVDGDSEDNCGIGSHRIRSVQSRRHKVVATPGKAMASSAHHKQRRRGARERSGAAGGERPESKRPRPNIDARAARRDSVGSVDSVDSAASLPESDTVPVNVQLQVWQGSEPILSTDALQVRRASMGMGMEFHDRYGSTLSPDRQNESLVRNPLPAAARALAGCRVPCPVRWLCIASRSRT